MPPHKNLTKWQPVIVKGSVQTVGTAFMTDNATTSDFIVDQSGNFIVTTPTIVIPPNVTVWTEPAAS